MIKLTSNKFSVVRSRLLKPPYAYPIFIYFIRNDKFSQEDNFDLKIMAKTFVYDQKIIYENYDEEFVTKMINTCIHGLDIRLIIELYDPACVYRGSFLNETVWSETNTDYFCTKIKNEKILIIKNSKSNLENFEKSPYDYHTLQMNMKFFDEINIFLKNIALNPLIKVENLDFIL